MPQNVNPVFVQTSNNVHTVKTLKNGPGTVLSVVCLTPGTIDLIDDTNPAGAGAAIPGFPATMTAGEKLPINANALVGISVKSPITGSYQVVMGG
jgi:hypothetical protein